MKERYVYLRHPDSRRVLALTESSATTDFVRGLQKCGYLLATREDFWEQEEERQARRVVPAEVTP